MPKKTLILILLLGLLMAGGCSSASRGDDERLGTPNLPQPIARDRVLVTTAGQGIEGLIIAKYLEQLNIRNYYRHRAEPVDLQDVKSVIIAVGFSPNGLDTAFLDVPGEKKRIQNLVNAAEEAELPIIVTHIGGMERRSPLNDQVARELIKKADYLVVTQEGNQDGFFTTLAQEENVPYTEVSSLETIKVPLNSAYR